MTRETKEALLLALLVIGMILLGLIAKCTHWGPY